LKLNRKLAYIALLYFAEGFPFGILEQTLPVYFRLYGMSLAHLGLLSLFSLPFALKFLWAPAVDFVGKRRHWIIAAQFCMAAAILAIIPHNPSSPSIALWMTIAALAICSATQDIAIDAYSIELLTPSEMGMANGFRQAAYRVALVVAGGLFVALGGHVGWEFTYTAASGILLLCALASMRLPAVEVTRPAVSPKALLAPVVDFLKRPGLASVAAFILLYKLGDMSIGPMVRPFWLDAGLTTTEIGLITGTVGILAAILGGLVGGMFMDRYGIFHGLWFLGLWQSVSNLSYAAVAWYPWLGKWGVYGASAAESFCGGLGTAAFLAFLMSICKKEYSASQYAILSALFRVSGISAGALSGWATAYLGYPAYFSLTFFLSIPAFAFIFHAREWIPVNGDTPRDRDPVDDAAKTASGTD
jgi:PAT family beta-lactamase induction signal transducer AmpG